MIGSYEKAKEIIGGKIQDLWEIWNMEVEISSPTNPVKMQREEGKKKGAKSISKNSRKKQKKY
jgi:hypothetical protein